MKILSYLAAALFFLAATACSASAEVIGTTDEEVQAIAGPALDGILKGLKTGNYAEYSKDFDDTLKEAVPEGQFVKVKDQIDSTLGSCESKTYLGYLQKGPTTVILWKGKFSKTGDDQLIKLIMSKRGNKDLVTGLWFQ